MFDVEDAVDALCEAVGGDDRPMWTVFDRGDGRPEGFHLLPGPASMIGWTAPAEVWAVGVIGGGTATPTSGGRADGRRCQVACVVDRWGVASGRIRFDSPPPSISDGVICEAPADGMVLDISRRCLGLPTTPPTDPVACVLALVWLAAVAEESHHRRRPLRFDEAVLLHPVVGLLDPPITSIASLAALIETASLCWGWREIRERCIGRGIRMGTVTPELAAWMDAGMMARWLVADHEEVEAVMDRGIEAVAEADHPALQRLLLDSGEDRNPGDATHGRMSPDQLAMFQSRPR